MATGLVKCNKASLCYRKHKRETLKSKRKAIIAGERNSMLAERLRDRAPSRSQAAFPRPARPGLRALGGDGARWAQVTAMDQTAHVTLNQRELSPLFSFPKT